MFFRLKKPNKFNYKAKYIAEKKIEEREGLPEYEDHLQNEMYDRWNRSKYSDLKRKGKRNLYFSFIFIIAVIYAAVTFYEELIKVF